MGYTASYAGYVTAFMGVGAVLKAPVVAKLMEKVDPRVLVFFGILWLAFCSVLRRGWTNGADFWALSIPQMLQGFGIPLKTIALGSVEPEEMASAAGVMSVLRTMAGAIGTSIFTTVFNDGAVVARSEIVSKLNGDATSAALLASAFPLIRHASRSNRL